MKIFFVVLIGLSSFIYGDFNRENGVVTDSSTRLQWQDDYSDNAHDIKDVNWKEAIQYCEGLGLSSHNDWRLPSVNELSSLIDYSKTNPSINPIFEYIGTLNYWSSTTLVSYSGEAFLISFHRGNQGSYFKSYSYYVRCVRSGK